MKCPVAWIAALTAAGTTLAATGPERPEVTAPPGSARLAEWGFLDVTAAPFLADPTGQSDSTRALQQAIVSAREHQLVAFFPPGTYLVSDTLECVQTRHDPLTQQVLRSRRGRDWPCVLMGSRRGPKRPVIRLADHAPGSGSPEHFAGDGVDPRTWHMVEEFTADGKTVRTPPLDRPVLYRRGRPESGR